MKKNILAASFMLLLSVASLSADINPAAGRDGAGALAFLPSARSGAMGNAFAALAENSDVLLGSPAGLARLSRFELMAGYKPMIENVAQQQLSLIVPLWGYASAENLDTHGTFGFSMASIDYGDLSGRTLANTAASDFSAEDKLFTVGYGRWIAKGLAVGASAKNFYTRIAEKSASHWTGDASILFAPDPHMWRVSFSVINMGGHYQLDGQSEKMAGAGLLGLAMTPHKSLTILVDAIDPRDDRLGVRGGVEWWAVNSFALRAGYDQTRNIDSGLTFGAGFRIQEFEALFFPLHDIYIDYAFSPAASDFNESGAGSQNISLTVKFGGE